MSKWKWFMRGASTTFMALAAITAILRDPMQTIVNLLWALLCLKLGNAA